MTNKIRSIIVLSVLFLLNCVVINAQDTKEGWQLELKKISLNLTSTEVKNADTYSAFPNSRLTADTQSLIQGYFDFAADYHASKYLWANSLIAEYGRTRVKPVNGVETKSENVDRIIVTSDIAYKMKAVESFLGGFEVGPFASASYETEFTAQGSTPRRQFLRQRAGVKAFDGKYIKNFYAAIVLEEDLTYSTVSYNTAWEAGLKLEHTIREGVKGAYSATFRDYLDQSETQPTDLDYELELDARMDVLVFKNLSVAPFITYYIAQGKYVSGLGQNLYVGVSFSFSHVFKEAKTIN